MNCRSPTLFGAYDRLRGHGARAPQQARRQDTHWRAPDQSRARDSIRYRNCAIRGRLTFWRGVSARAPSLSLLLCEPQAGVLPLRGLGARVLLLRSGGPREGPGGRVPGRGVRARRGVRPPWRLTNRLHRKLILPYLRCGIIEFGVVKLFARF